MKATEFDAKFDAGEDVSDAVAGLRRVVVMISPSA